MAAFPTDIACIVKEGFKITQPAAKRYLGNQSWTDFTEMQIVIHIDNPTDLEAFGDWWHNTINGGADAFDLTLGIYDSPKVVSVKIASDMNFTVVKGIYVMKGTLKAQEAMHPPV